MGRNTDSFENCKTHGNHNECMVKKWLENWLEHERVTPIMLILSAFSFPFMVLLSGRSEVRILSRSPKPLSKLDQMRTASFQLFFSSSSSLPHEDLLKRCVMHPIHYRKGEDPGISD